MDIFEWVASVGGVVLAGILVAWLTGLLARMVRLAARCKLAITNIWRSRRPPLDNRFRFVLCCLEGDVDGRDTATVNDAFQEISGVALVPSARIVKAKGAGDDWRPAMREQANAILRTWRGDLAVVDRVEKPREKLSLWFVPREGDGTLGRAEQQFMLNGGVARRGLPEDASRADRRRRLERRRSARQRRSAWKGSGGEPETSCWKTWHNAR